MNLATPPPHPLSQHRQALTRWHFLCALALLALNDHVLKHAGLLPAWFTGKLSDFAGLYVAPVLLCTLLRQEGRRALAYCSLLTGVMFTTLELSPPAARAVEVWTARFGFPWLLTCDVTDLLALPMLWVGYRAFSAPAQHCLADDNAVRVRPSLRWHERVVAALATLACAATSSPEGPFGATVTQGPVVVNGSEDNNVELRLQVPRADIFIDCAAIAESPGEHLPLSAFGPVIRLGLGPLQTLLLDQWTPWNAECSIALVEIAGRSPVLFFWQWDRFEGREVPSELSAGQLKRVAEAPQYVTVLFNEGRAERFKDNGDVVFAFEPRVLVEDACEPNPETQELWTPFGSPGTPLYLSSKRYAADGCFDLTFSTTSASLQEPANFALWLCVPEAAFPFEVDDALTLQQNETELLIERVEDRALLRVLSNGVGTVDLVIAELTPSADSDCPYRTFEDPTLTTRRTSVRIETPWGSATLKPTEQQWLRSDTRDVLVGVIEARQDVLGSALQPHTSAFVLTLPSANQTAPEAQDLSAEKAEQP